MNVTPSTVQFTGALARRLPVTNARCCSGSVRCARCARDALTTLNMASADDIALAKLLGVEADPATDPHGFVRELRGKVAEVQAALDGTTDEEAMTPPTLTAPSANAFETGVLVRNFAVMRDDAGDYDDIECMSPPTINWKQLAASRAKRWSRTDADRTHAAPTVNRRPDDDDDVAAMTPPVINWKEQATSRR